MNHIFGLGQWIGISRTLGFRGSIHTFRPAAPPTETPTFLLRQCGSASPTSPTGHVGDRAFGLLQQLPAMFLPPTPSSSPPQPSTGTSPPSSAFSSSPSTPSAAPPPTHYPVTPSPRKVLQGR